jgi:L-lactate dehydrogenase
MIRITEAVLMNQHSVLTVGTLMQGQYGIKDVCLSLPCVVGAKGITACWPILWPKTRSIPCVNPPRILRDGLDSVGY